MTTAAATRRYEAIAPANDTLVILGFNSNTDTDTVDEYRAVAEYMASLATMGRTNRWINSCGFALSEFDGRDGELTIERARWATLQGLIFMGQSAE